MQLRTARIVPPVSGTDNDARGGIQKMCGRFEAVMIAVRLGVLKSDEG